MSLAAYESALGARIRRDVTAIGRLTRYERDCVDRVASTPGFRLTVDVQRSWCAGRAASIARQTLSMLEPSARDRILRHWTERGGGASAFVESEAEALFEFIAASLEEASDVLTMCRMEQAVHRAAAYAPRFVRTARNRVGDDAIVARSAHAALVANLIFAPGIDGLVRRATDAEMSLWQALAVPMRGCDYGEPAVLADLIDAGAIEVMAGGTRPREGDCRCNAGA